MVDSYIAGAERLDGQRSGDTYRLPASPWRVVWHTVEGKPSSVANARSLAANHQYPPHLWAYYEFDWVGQTVPLNRSAYALVHKPGDPETNHRHAIQIEVFGFAKDQPLTGAQADWLGRRVLSPILDAGVPISAFKVAPSTGSDGYGTDGKVRQTWDWWTNFNGQCGHANVPGNVHWDPGVADYLRSARVANVHADNDEDESMIHHFKSPTRPYRTAVDGTLVGWPDAGDRDEFIALAKHAGVKVVAHTVSEKTFDALSAGYTSSDDNDAIEAYLASLVAIEQREEDRDLASPPA